MFEPDHLMECPDCGKRALVKQNNTIYQCLSCRFRRDVSDAGWNDTSVGFLTIVMIFFVVFLVGKQAPRVLIPSPIQPGSLNPPIEAPPQF
jgi:uncharacterized protein (DUF983 family)